MGTLVLPPMDSQQHALPPPAFSMLPSSFAPAGLMRPYAQAPVAQVPSFQQIQQPPQPQQPQQQHAGRGRMQQQPQQQKGLGPRTSRGKKRKHRWHGKGRGDGAPPSLAALSAQNRRRAQQHFGNDTPMSEAPRTAPHAPHNDNSFILSQHGRVSSGGRFESPAMAPSQPSNEVQWTPRHDGFPADYGSLGKDAADLGAQLDFFGTNEGLVARYSSEDDSSDADGHGSEEEGDEQHGWRLRAADQSGAAAPASGLPDHVRARLASQAAYIAQLEAENLDLQEKYSLLQHELEEHKAAARTATAATAATAEEPAAASAKMTGD